MSLKNKTIAILIAPKYQDDEATSPRRYLVELGADVKYIGLQKGSCPGKGQGMVEVEAAVGDVHPGQFDGLIIPGGAAPEALRQHKEVLQFVRDFMNEAKPVGAICHGAQVLISAGVAKARTMTAYAGIRDDVVNAGARYLDQEVVVDDNLVTSRIPQDLPAFNKAFADILGKYDQEKTPWANASPSQVLEYAIMQEIKAMTLYENLAKKTKDKLSKAKFKFLAETERAHRDTLTEIFEKTNQGKKPTPRDLGISQGEPGVEIDPDGDLLKILRGAMGAEDAAYRLYSEVAEKASNLEAKAIFRHLADEEISHKRLLEAEYGLKAGYELPSSLEKAPWWSEELW